VAHSSGDDNEDVLLRGQIPERLRSHEPSELGNVRSPRLSAQLRRKSYQKGWQLDRD
jgi:hypothetical protein